MGYSPWHCKESETAEQLTLSFSFIETVGILSIENSPATSGNLEGKNLRTVLAAARVLP